MHLVYFLLKRRKVSVRVQFALLLHDGFGLISGLDNLRVHNLLLGSLIMRWLVGAREVESLTAEMEFVLTRLDHSDVSLSLVRYLLYLLWRHYLWFDVYLLRQLGLLTSLEWLRLLL